MCFSVLSHSGQCAIFRAARGRGNGEEGEARNEKSLLGLQRVNIACPSHSSNQIVTISVLLPSDNNFYGNLSFIPSPPSSEYLSNVGGLLFQCADINRVVWGTKSFQTVGW